jgi:O-antigen ligase
MRHFIFLILVILIVISSWGIVFLIKLFPLSTFTLIATFSLIIFTIKYPEYTVAILYVGMFLWEFFPTSGILSGYRVPITLLWLMISYLLHGFIIDRRGFRFTFTKLDLQLGIFCGFAGFSLLWSGNRDYGIWKLSLFFGMSVLLAWFLRCFYSSRPLRLPLLIWATSIVSLIPLFLLTWVSLDIGGIEGLIPGRFYTELRLAFDTMFSVYGASDALMIGGLLITYYLIKTSRRFLKGLFVISLVWYAWGLLMLGQRTQFLVWLIGVVLLFWHLSKDTTVMLWRKKTLRTVLILLMIYVGIWSQITYNPRSNLAFLEEDMSLTNRLVAIEVALAAFADQPLVGVGLGDYEKYSQRYSYKFQGKPGELGSKLHTEVSRSFPHNIFFEILSETGIIGFALWILSFFTILSLIFSAWNIKSTKLSGLFVTGNIWFLTRLLIGMSSGDLASLAWGPPLAIISLTQAQNVKASFSISNSQRKQYDVTIW